MRLEKVQVQKTKQDKCTAFIARSHKDTKVKPNQKRFAYKQEVKSLVLWISL